MLLPRHKKKDKKEEKEKNLLKFICQRYCPEVFDKSERKHLTANEKRAPTPVVPYVTFSSAIPLSGTGGANIVSVMYLRAVYPTTKKRVCRLSTNIWLLVLRLLGCSLSAYNIFLFAHPLISYTYCLTLRSHPYFL